MSWAYEYLPYKDDPSRKLLFSEPLVNGKPDMERGRLLAGRITIADEFDEDHFSFMVNPTPDKTTKRLGLPELTAVALKGMDMVTANIKKITASSRDKVQPGMSIAEQNLQRSALRRAYAELGATGQRAGCLAVGNCFREGFFEADPYSSTHTLFGHIRAGHPFNKSFVPYPERFLQIAPLLGEGLLNPQIAERLSMGTGAVHTCIHRISNDLQVSTPELVVLAGITGQLPRTNE